MEIVFAASFKKKSSNLQYIFHYSLMNKKFKISSYYHHFLLI